MDDCPIYGLPDELLLSVLAFLPIDALCSIASVRIQ